MDRDEDRNARGRYNIYVSWILLGAIRPPSIGWTSVLLFCGCFGMIMTDVMADTLVVEKVALEQGKQIGSIQTLVWTLRFAGSFLVN